LAKKFPHFFKKTLFHLFIAFFPSVYAISTISMPHFWGKS
jgi:hypothetical protein